MGTQSTVFSSTATGVRRWNRATTSGMVKSQITALISVKWRRLWAQARTSRAGQGRLAATSRSSGSGGLARQYGANQKIPATERNDSCAPA